MSASREDKLVEVIPMSTKKIKVNFIEKSPNGESKMIQITPEELAQRTGQAFQWTETILTNPEHLRNNSQLPMPCGTEVSEDLLKRRIENSIKTQQKLAVLKLSKINWSVKTIEDLPAHSFLLYAGSYDPISHHENFTYAIGVPDSSNSRIIQNVDAESHRNLTAFIMHLPENTDDYEFESTVRQKDILLFNMNMVIFIFKRIPFIFLYNPKPIPQNSLIGFPYEKTNSIMWQNWNIIPHLIYRDQQLVPPTQYRAKVIRISFGNHFLMAIRDNVLEAIQGTNKWLQGNQEQKPNPQIPGCVKIREESIRLALEKNPNTPYINLTSTDLTFPADDKIFPPSATTEIDALFIEQIKELNRAMSKSSDTNIFKEQIQSLAEPLKRITAQVLPGTPWRFDVTKQLACIESKDEATMKRIHEHFKSFKTNYGRSTKTGNVLLQLVNPPKAELERLDAIPAEVPTNNLNQQNRG